MKDIIIFYFLFLFFFSCETRADFFNLGSYASPGKLSKYHSSMNGAKECFKCHTWGKGILDENCMKCHTEIQRSRNSNSGLHGKRREKCIQCHSEHKGEKFEIRNLDITKFDHEKLTAYELIGKHAKVKCQECHKEYRRDVITKAKTIKRTYIGKSTICVSCHKNKHLFRTKEFLYCHKCHSENSWKVLKNPMDFNHSTDTKFQLQGKHGTLECKKCHKTAQFGTKPGNVCGNCHKPKHEMKFGPDCTKCHGFTDFKSGIQAKLTELTVTKEGFKHTETFFACDKCHKDPHNKQFPDKKCEACHKNLTKWKEMVFSHSRDAQFATHSTHAEMACPRCHTVPGVYRNIGKKCIDCHLLTHQGKYGNMTAEMINCDKCHNEFNLLKTDFNHALKANITFEGKHGALKCNDCHLLEKENTNKPNNCQYCHKKPHKGKSFDVCTTCHNQINFREVSFSHNRQSEFKVDGAHVDLVCRRCHAEGYETFEEKGCDVCHEDIHKNVFGKDCEKCHTTKDFRQIYFPHKYGKYSLGGVHDKLDCSSCHSRGKFVKGKINFCKDCHNDPHVNSFGNNCLDCHNQNAWLPTTFRHNITGFDLDGAHRFVDCNGCHKNRIYGGLPTACYICHQKDFVLQGPHIDKKNFKQFKHCELCHFTTNWFPVKRR